MKGRMGGTPQWIGNANYAPGLTFLPEVGTLTSLRKEEVRGAVGYANPQVNSTKFIVKLKANTALKV